MNVLGVDPSLTSTGLALVGDGVDLSTSRTRKTRPGLDEKADRIQTQARAVSTAAQRADLVMVEALSLASTGSATRDLAGLWWLILTELRRVGVPIGIVTPSCLKKWLTDNGNADKDLMRRSVAKYWPGVESANSDEADALALASMGLHHLGSLPWWPERHQEAALTKVQWLLPCRAAA